MNRRDLIRARHRAASVSIARPAAKLPGDDVGRIPWRGQGRDEAAVEASAKPWWPRRKSDAPSPPSNGWWCWALHPLTGGPP